MSVKIYNRSKHEEYLCWYTFLFQGPIDRWNNQKLSFEVVFLVFPNSVTLIPKTKEKKITSKFWIFISQYSTICHKYRSRLLALSNRPQGDAFSEIDFYISTSMNLTAFIKPDETPCQKMFITSLINGTEFLLMSSETFFQLLSVKALSRSPLHGNLISVMDLKLLWNALCNLLTWRKIKHVVSWNIHADQF